jgi:putative membrane protein
VAAVPPPFSWTSGSIHPEVVLGCGLLAAAWAWGWHARGSRPHPGQAARFVGGLVAILLALNGPLHDLSDWYLFSAHMVQHLVLILIMPPLLLHGVPDWMLRPVIRIRPLGWLARLVTFPIVAFALNNIIFLAWHFPGPYDLMMRNHDVHVTMHLMIMVTGTIMWWPVMSPLPELPRIAAPLQMLYLFVLGIPMMISAAMITFSKGELYSWYAEAPRIFGITVLDDQRLGGVIMWVPGGLILWIAITVVYFRWTRPEVAEDEDAGRLAKQGLVLRPPPFPQR